MNTENIAIIKAVGVITLEEYEPEKRKLLEGLINLREQLDRGIALGHNMT